MATPATRKNTAAVNYDITIQNIESTTLICKSARCEQAAIAKHLGQILPAVFQHVTTAGIEMVGPPTTIYQEWGPGVVTIQAGIPVVPGAEGHEEFEVVVFEAGPAAVTIHTGSYDGLGDAYAAVEQYLRQVGRKPNGPVREVYLTDPGEVPNPEDWKTQIIWPVEA
ncbi:MAG: GyrI-like domain-containing protein [Myxococcota bacterium]